MMNIDIERLIDAVAACNEAYNEYCYSSKTLYRGPFEEITTRKNHVNYAREVHDREQNAAAYPGHHARPDPPVYLRRTRST